MYIYQTHLICIDFSVEFFEVVDGVAVRVDDDDVGAGGLMAIESVGADGVTAGGDADGALFVESVRGVAGSTVAGV